MKMQSWGSPEIPLLLLEPREVQLGLECRRLLVSLILQSFFYGELGEAERWCWQLLPEEPTCVLGQSPSQRQLWLLLIAKSRTGDLPSGQKHNSCRWD